MRGSLMNASIDLGCLKCFFDGRTDTAIASTVARTAFPDSVKASDRAECHKPVRGLIDGHQPLRFIAVVEVFHGEALWRFQE
jgi:hypothetical protein